MARKRMKVITAAQKAARRKNMAIARKARNYRKNPGAVSIAKAAGRLSKKMGQTRKGFKARRAARSMGYKVGRGGIINF